MTIVRSYSLTMYILFWNVVFLQFPNQHSASLFFVYSSISFYCLWRGDDDCPTLRRIASYSMLHVRLFVQRSVRAYYACFFFLFFVSVCVCGWWGWQSVRWRKPKQKQLKVFFNKYRTTSSSIFFIDDGYNKNNNTNNNIIATSFIKLLTNAIRSE